MLEFLSLLSPEATQAGIAKAMGSMFGVTCDQGRVSRWLERVKTWVEAGNVLPDLPTAPLTGRAQTMDPKNIDMGANPEHRAPHQRNKGKEE